MDRFIFDINAPGGSQTLSGSLLTYKLPFAHAEKKKDSFV